MTKTRWQKLETATDAERIGGALVELLDSDEVRTWADALTELADAIDDARQSVETYTETTDREEKADAKADALDLLQVVLDRAEDVRALDDLDGLCETVPQ
jgi:hypothetical protein